MSNPEMPDLVTSPVAPNPGLPSHGPIAAIPQEKLGVAIAAITSIVV
jgi:hypothetical protein